MDQPKPEVIADIVHALSNPTSPDGISPTVAREAKEKLADAIEAMLPEDSGLRRQSQNDEAYIESEGTAHIRIEFDREVEGLENAARQTLSAEFRDGELTFRPGTVFFNDLAGDASQDYTDIGNERTMAAAPANADRTALAQGAERALDLAMGALDNDREQMLYLIADHVLDGAVTPEGFEFRGVFTASLTPQLEFRVDTEAGDTRAVVTQPDWKQNGRIEGSATVYAITSRGRGEMLAEIDAKGVDIKDFIESALYKAEERIAALAQAQEAKLAPELAVMERNGYLGENSRDIVATVVGRSAAGTKLYVDFGGGEAGRMNEALVALNGEAGTRSLEVVKGAGKKTVAVLDHSAGKEPAVSVLSFLATVNGNLPKDKTPLALGDVRGAEPFRPKAADKGGVER